MAFRKKDAGGTSDQNRGSVNSGKLRRTGREVTGTVDERMMERYGSEAKERIADESEVVAPPKKPVRKPKGKRSFKERIIGRSEQGDIYRVKGSIDRPMLIIILMLIGFGCVMVFSASYAYALNRYGDSYYYIKRQLLFVAIGVTVMAAASFVDYKVIKRLTPLYFGAALILLLVVLAAGVASGVAKRWIDLGPFTIQPSEIMKLGLILMMALYYSRVGNKVREGGFWKTSTFGFFIPFLFVAVVCGLIILERHLSGTIILFAIGMVVIWCAGGRMIWFGVGVLGAAALGVVAVNSFEYAAKRVDIWLHPENYSIQSEVWQTLQGMYAVGSGGIFGVGIGNSRQKHLFVSQPQNDFIFSILCEELGLIGALCVIALFIAFLIRGVIIARRAPDTFSRLTVIGIVAKVTIQAFLNIAVVTNTIPNTGISLPFFSYGGTALIMLLTEMGVLLSISRYTRLQT